MGEEPDAGPPPGRGIYCNRTLNLRAIKAIGYDMDYTLVHYRVDDWERRAYEFLRDKLSASGWPVSKLQFDSELVQRGLVIDTELGNLLKVNRFGYVKAARHGTRAMDYEGQRDLYACTVIDLSNPRFRFLNTLFALSEGCMYAQLVDMLDDCELDQKPDDAVDSSRGGAEHLGYHDLYHLVRRHIDATHMEGELKSEIIANPDKFVELDADTVLALLDQYRAGKRLLLITNSEWPYAAAMMTYAFDRFLPDGMRWRELFEVSIVAARKPSFFESGAPLLRIINDAGQLEPHVGALVANDAYFGGNAAAIEKHLGIAGDEILYLGDHIFGDVHVPTSVMRWRTGLILRELEDELVAVEESRAQQIALSELMRQKEQLEWHQYQARIGLLRAKYGYGPKSDVSKSELNRRIHTSREAAVALDERIAPIAAAAGRVLNERWGLLMRAGNDKSQLARQIERYADVYTSRVSNFVYATPFAYLRSQRGSLPHDPVPLRAVSSASSS